MRTPLKAIRYAALASAVLASLPLVLASPQQPFSISISTGESVFKSGGEIKLQIVLTNTSNRDIVAAKGKGDAAEDAGYMIEVWDANGNHPSETRLLRVLKGEEELPQGINGGGVLVPLSPGQSVKDGMVVNKFYDLSKPGKYKIQMQRSDPETRTAVKSNVIVVTVTAELSDHPCRLPSGGRCEDILK